jgi:hypothetical protein
MLWGRFNSPQFEHSWNASTFSESCERRMPRREGDTFLLGTAMVAPFPEIDTSVRATCPKAIDAVILEGRPYGKGSARTSNKQVRGFLGQQRREGGRYSEKFARCNPRARALAGGHIIEGIST